MRGPQVITRSLFIAAAFATGACGAESPVGPGSPRVDTPAALASVAPDPVHLNADTRAVQLCHRRGGGGYQVLRVSGAAEAAHRAHGDYGVGEPVPGTTGLVFDENCAAAAPVAVITAGTWSVDDLQRSQFTLEGPQLSAAGVWLLPAAPTVCTQCGAGQTFSIRAVFDNPMPMTDIPQATGRATVFGTVYPPPIEFGGPITFETAAMTIPDSAPGEAVTVSAPFVMSGRLKGYEVVGRRDPLLLFDVPVRGRGTATLVVLSGAFHSLRFDFTE